MAIIWSRMAKITFFEIIENLNKNWTEKEVLHFKELTDYIFQLIKDDKVSFSLVVHRSLIRRVKIHANVSLFYKQDEERNIILITFFNNKMDPNLLKRLLR